MADLCRPLAAILAENGWSPLRAGKGGHEIWTDRAGARHVTVPRSTKRRHAANEVPKQAGPPKAF